MARSSITQKQKFLRSKGLTEDEIQMACERAGVFTKDPNANTIINMGISHAPQIQQHSGMISMFHKAREVISSTALLAGIMYGIYVVYKVCVTRFLLKYLNWWQR